MHETTTREPIDRHRQTDRRVTEIRHNRPRISREINVITEDVGRN